MKASYKGKTFQIEDEKIVTIDKDYSTMGEFRHNRAVILGFDGEHFANIIDENGKKILPERKYKYIDGFYEELALCTIESEEHEDPEWDKLLVEYIDVNGNVIIGPIRCAYAKYFYNGCAIIRDIDKIKHTYFEGNESYYFIDKEGNKVDGEIKDEDFYSKYPRYDQWHSRNNSIYEWEFPDGYKKIYYCKSGKVYDGTQAYEDCKEKKPALIDPNGKLVIPPIFKNMSYANGKILADGMFFDIKDCSFDYDFIPTLSLNEENKTLKTEIGETYKDSTKKSSTKKGISKLMERFKNRKNQQ